MVTRITGANRSTPEESLLVRLLLTGLHFSSAPREGRLKPADVPWEINHPWVAEPESPFSKHSVCWGEPHTSEPTKGCPSLFFLPKIQTWVSILQFLASYYVVGLALVGAE